MEKPPTPFPKSRKLSKPDEIGRASCRERVQISVVAVSLKKKKKKNTNKENNKEEEQRNRGGQEV